VLLFIAFCGDLPKLANAPAYASIVLPQSVNRAAVRGEIEGKAATGSGERVGKGASFKSVVVCSFVIGIHSSHSRIKFSVVAKPLYAICGSDLAAKGFKQKIAKRTKV
jgi:hypothetical protein